MSDSETPLLDPVAAYARWAASYPPHAHNPLMRAEERAMLSLLPTELRGRVVLDAGCGSGRYMLHSLRRGAQYVLGVDLSTEMLQRAAAELQMALSDWTPQHSPSAGAIPAATLVKGSVAALPLPGRWADVTICALTVGHLPSLKSTLAELRRVTRPDGRILCSDFHPLAHARGARREFNAGGQRYAVRHTPHQIGDWRDACAALGLRIVRMLEPMLDPADVRGHGHVDGAALEAPVVLVLELDRTNSARSEG
jgi:malonyl-CoA O-methyltransferase